MRHIIKLLTAVLCGICFTANAQMQVTDEKGYPLLGALVQRLVPNAVQLPPAADQYTTVGVSGEDGVVRVEPSTSPTLILVSKQGHVIVAFHGHKPLPPSVALGPHAEIGGWIYDSKGTTITEATIGPVLPVTSGEENEKEDTKPPIAPIYGSVGAGGFFRIGGLEPGQYSYLAQAPGHAPEIGLAVTGELTSLTLPARAVRYTGVVLGSKDRQPQPNVIVEAHAGLMKLYTTSGEKGEFGWPLLQPAEWQFNTTLSPMDKPKMAPMIQNGTGDKGRDVVILHNQGVTIAGQFLDAETSEPISSMALRLNTFEADAPRTTTTDTEGRFSFEKVDAFRNISLAFDPERYAFRSRQTGQWGDRISISTQPAQDITTISARLIPRVLVEGRVVAPNQKNVPGADIVLRTVDNVDQGAGELRRPSVYNVRSDAAGKFRLSVFPPGMYDARASAPFLGSDIVKYEASSTSPKELVIQMQRLVTLKGRALDADGKPLDRARVEFFSAQENGNLDVADNARLLASGRSDNRGRFSVESVFPDTVLVSATHPWYDAAVTTEVAVLGKDTPSFDIQFPPGQEFTAHVVTESGAAIEGATVQIYPPTHDSDQSSSSQALTRTTDFNGHAEFRLNARRLDKVVARHRDYAPFTATTITLKQQSYEIKLKPYPSVSVSIKAAPDVQEEKLRYIVWLLRANVPKGTTREPAPSQYFSLRHQQSSFGKAYFENVEPGWYKAAMSTDDENMYSESKAAFLKPDARSLELELRMASGATLSGRVTDEQTGEPVPGANVHVQLQGSTPAEFEVISRPTDSQGRYRIEVLPAAIVVLAAKHRDYSDKAQVLQLPPTGDINMDFKLNKSVARLSGHVRLDGRPVKDATIVVYANEDMGRWIGSAVTDDKGHYTIDGVPEGSRLVIAEALWGDDARGLRKRQTVLVSGSDTAADINFRALVRVHGRLQRNSAEVDANTKTTLYFSNVSSFGDMRHVIPGADGEYEVFVEPGTYNVSLTDGPGIQLDVPENRPELLANLDYDEVGRTSGAFVKPPPQLE